MEELSFFFFPCVPLSMRVFIPCSCTFGSKNILLLHYLLYFDWHGAVYINILMSCCYFTVNYSFYYCLYKHKHVDFWTAYIMFYFKILKFQNHT